MTVDELLEEIENLQPPGDLPVAVDGDFDVEVSVVRESSGDFLNIGQAGDDPPKGLKPASQERKPRPCPGR